MEGYMQTEQNLLLNVFSLNLVQLSGFVINEF